MVVAPEVLGRSENGPAINERPSVPTTTKATSALMVTADRDRLVVITVFFRAPCQKKFLPPEKFRLHDIRALRLKKDSQGDEEVGVTSGNPLFNALCPDRIMKKQEINGRMDHMQQARTIDLSADVGELLGMSGRGLDRALSEVVSTVHIATGAHAGDEGSMRAALQSCRLTGARVGAHPSYPDREGFGRRRFALSLEELLTSLRSQLDALDLLAREEGVVVTSVKPHGQLYHDLSEDEALAEAVFQMLLERDVSVTLAAGSRAVARARVHGLAVLEEGFCDRRYRQGRLVPRDEGGALLTDPRDAARQAIELVTTGLVADDGVHEVTTLCVHSDGPTVLELVAAVRAALERSGIAIAAP